MDKSSSEKFPQHVRIVRSVDYQKLYKTGRKVHSADFVLFTRGNALEHHRVGITVSRKIGNAVVRNRVKRLFREIFRRYFRLIPGRFDIVINAKSGCAKASYAGLQTEFMAAMKKLG